MKTFQRCYVVIFIAVTICLTTTSCNRLPNDNVYVYDFYSKLNDLYNKLNEIESSSGRRNNDFIKREFQRSYKREDIDETEEAKKKRELLDRFLPQKGELFEGDMIMNEDLRRAVIGGPNVKKSALSFKKLLWDKSENGLVYLPYVIDPSFARCSRELLKKTIQQFKQRTCIRLVPAIGNEKSFINYTSSIDQCSSHIGRQILEENGKSRGQEVFIGVHCCVLGTVEHETMHSLGFIHTHSRNDRDRYIEVKFENIDNDNRNNFEKYRYQELDSMGYDYDYKSIMHYRADAFSKNGENTIVVRRKEPTGDKISFGQRDGFSTQDIDQINTLYNCKIPPEIAHDGLIKSYSGYWQEKKRRDEKQEKIRDELLERFLYGRSYLG